MQAAAAPLLQSLAPLDYAASGLSARIQAGLAHWLTGPAFAGTLGLAFALTVLFALTAGAATGGAILGAAILWSGVGAGALFLPLLAGSVVALLDGDRAERPHLAATLAAVIPVAAIPSLGGAALGHALLTLAAAG